MARVDRVLTTPGGSLLMAGRSGVGRRTAVTLVSHMHQMELFTPRITRGYGMKQFKNDLKTVRAAYTFINLFLYIDLFYVNNSVCNINSQFLLVSMLQH